MRARGGWLALAASLVACGGGAPLLHPAHTLPRGDVSFAAGTSGRFSLGGLSRADRRLEETSASVDGATTTEQRADFVAGAVARFAVAPGVAPHLAGRVGLGDHNEAGLTYTGRGVRLDGRHAFEWPTVALSIGVAATGALARPGKQAPGEVESPAPEAAGLRTVALTSLSGYGLELPVLFGWRSDADVVKLWTGLRVGFERDTFNVTLVESSSDTATGSTGAATRFWGGGLVGFSVGLDPIEVRVELNAAHERARGKLRTRGGDISGDVAGWTLTPAMAISAKF